MKQLVQKIYTTIISIWKPDFRKTTGYLFISTGLALLAPPFIQDLILDALGAVDIVPTGTLKHTSLTGSLLLFSGVLYHLLYLDSTNGDTQYASYLSALLVFVMVLIVVVNVL